VRIFIIPALIVCLSACSWFGSRRPPPSVPTELIVTGAPVGSMTFVDGVQSGSGPAGDTRPQVVSVKPGSHVVEIRLGEPVVYREETDVARGEKRLVTVLSGSSR
jgi:hypothetical protein